MELYGIIFHVGSSMNAGHYKSAVLVENNWYMTNDSTIGSWTPTFNYGPSSAMYPYCVIYKKSEDVDFNISSSSTSVLSDISPAAVASSTVSTYANAVLRNLNVPSDNPDKKKQNFADHKSFENLNKAIENDNDRESSDALKTTKQSVISELFYQTKKIETAKENNLSRSSSNDKLSNFKNKKRHISTTSAERMKKSRAQATPEKKEQEKFAQKASKANLRAQATPEKKRTRKIGSESKQS